MKITKDIVSASRGLLQAASDGYFNSVVTYLKEGADVHYDEDTAIIYASGGGHLKIVDVLLEAGADIHAREGRALKTACEWGHCNIVKRLLKAGADVHTNEGHSLIIASLNGHLNVVKILLEAGADPVADGGSSLTSACEYGKLDVAKCLVKAGADIHVNNENALMWACQYQHLPVIEWLLKSGAVVDNSLLTSVCKNKGYSLLKVLVEQGVDPNLIVQMCLYKKKPTSVKELLKQFSDRIEIKDKWLIFACKKNYVTVVVAMVKAGCNVRTRDDFVLRYAIQHNYKNLLSLIRKRYIQNA
jgi:ankyrin repeat protein